MERGAEHIKRSPTYLNRQEDRLALRATVHCLAGCSIGEVLGMALGGALRWSDGKTVVVSIVLAFVSGYALTLIPLRRSGLSWGKALSLALASDTLSIALMEVVDNGVMLVVPGAMGAPLDAPLFWGAMAASLVLAGIAAFPLNRWLIRRGKGHAVTHAYHAGHASTEEHGGLMRVSHGHPH
ncbi:MAG: DUF4396 domain-containing protein [Deltaproteobacteria bacterium]|nr:DUF4396 domain-containing protein [Deltaproteobacteria bacterium]